jgi:transcriptional regulator with XRE-family HTH domain
MSDQHLTAGQYLRKRREAAGLSIDEVAAGCAMPATRDAFAARLARIEGDDVTTSDITLAMLRSTFRFDRQIYHNLAAGLPAGTTLCRRCAYAWTDDAAGRPPTYWPEPDLCARCAPTAAAELPPEPAMIVGAANPFAVPVITILGLLELGNWADARLALDDAIRDASSLARIGSAPAAAAEQGMSTLAVAQAMTEWRRARRPSFFNEVLHV